MLVSHVEKSSITSGPHGIPPDELLLLLLLAVAPLLLLTLPLLLPLPLLLLAVAVLLALPPPVPGCPPVPIDPPAPVLDVGADPSRLMQTPSTHERFARQVLPEAHGHRS
jgi:hypothetical protein